MFLVQHAEGHTLSAQSVWGSEGQTETGMTFPGRVFLSSSEVKRELDAWFIIHRLRLQPPAVSQH